MSLKHNLSKRQITRYSRQLILSEIGVVGQSKLSSSSILIVGAGGLGCPASIYLAAAGIGCIGIVDDDDVDLSNLHRQILHTEARAGTPKVSSASLACSQINGTIQIVPYHVKLTPQNALKIFTDYDIILDCTDNAESRYLINDAAVISGKPLVSGSALRFEGQLTVYHHENGPCYRCIFPKPPSPASRGSCSDNGVLGVVPGIIGSMQALEAMKIILGRETLNAKLFLFDALNTANPRCVTLRQRDATCVVCGDRPVITAETLPLFDYDTFCGGGACATVETPLPPNERISVEEYADVVKSDTPHVLVDVRPDNQLAICALPNTVSCPISLLRDGSSSRVDDVKRIVEQKQSEFAVPEFPVYVICRRGNDSQRAVPLLRSALPPGTIVRDIIGGLTEWANTVDANFPTY